jgi:hypothetical protein
MPAVEDEGFWTDVQPLRFGPLPNLQESVYVVGYPIGELMPSNPSPVCQ